MDYGRHYVDMVEQLLTEHPKDEAMSLAVGGAFEAIGRVERDIVAWAGLREGQYLIDVGCGSGRLAAALRDLRIQYLGTDVVPALLDHARSLCRRPDWRFERVTDLVLPERDETADMICFFSVLTHLLHEHSYRYLAEARRILKRGGTVIASFLEFAAWSWPVFEQMLAGANNVPNQFLSRDAFACWAPRLGLRIEAMYGGNENVGAAPRLGQSVCLLRKP